MVGGGSRLAVLSAEVISEKWIRRKTDGLTVRGVANNTNKPLLKIQALFLRQMPYNVGEKLAVYRRFCRSRCRTWVNIVLGIGVALDDIQIAHLSSIEPHRYRYLLVDIL